MIMQDKLEKERNDAKNNVEEYVYEMRDKLHGVLEKFVNEAVSIDGSHLRAFQRLTRTGSLNADGSFVFVFRSETPSH